jgi:hypothetical protein
MSALNGDLSQFVVMRTAEMPWSASPSGTVWRKRLHRVGPEESGQVTTVVRFEPGATFASHDHPDGEEILVLDGVFSDEQGDFGKGSYLLNPEGFRHAPFSREGCTLFVKLRQYPGRNRPERHLDTAGIPWETQGPGVRSQALFNDEGFPDSTWLEEWQGGHVREFSGEGGVEIFLIEGTAECREGLFGPGDWLRFPAGRAVEISARTAVRAYVKRGFYDLLDKRLTDFGASL